MFGLETFHENIILGMLRGVCSKRSPHAYLFSGEAGRGQDAAARLLAYSLVCEHREMAPCMNCPSCLQAREGLHRDIKYIRPEKDKKQISVELIRELVIDMSTKPFGTGSKIYIIEDASGLNTASQNALLKSLEEPPEYVVFIIIADTDDLLLPTILSRCTKIAFPPVCEDELVKFVNTNYPLYAEDAQRLATFCEGNPLNIKKLLEDEAFTSLRNGAVVAFKRVISTNKLDSFWVENYAEENKESFDEIIDIWLGLVRDLLMLKVDQDERVLNFDVIKDLSKIMIGCDGKKLITAVDALTKAKAMLTRHISAKAIAMNVCIKLKME